MGNSASCMSCCQNNKGNINVDNDNTANQIEITPETKNMPEEKIQNKKVKNLYSEESEESEEDDEYDAAALAQMQSKVKKNARVSVSAEAYGLWNKKSAYVPKIISKSDEQKNKIRVRISKSFMFAALDDKALEIVIDAMGIKNFEAGEWVIKQGEPGDDLYVVEKGELDCFKQFTKDIPPKYLKTYQPGESFGELALLYNVPRAASIQAKTQATLFSLDRECFNHIVKDSAVKKREKYENFLANIDLLSTMDSYERSVVAEAIKSVKFRKGEYVVREGEQGNTFYFIEEGNAIATKVLTPGEAPVKVKSYGLGDYFGELALLKDQPRAANIIAETDLVLASLDRNSFKRLLGPLEDILKRNIKQYEKFSTKN